jgi:hypothetical protein
MTDLGPVALELGQCSFVCSAVDWLMTDLGVPNQSSGVVLLDVSLQPIDKGDEGVDPSDMLLITDGIARTDLSALLHSDPFSYSDYPRLLELLDDPVSPELSGIPHLPYKRCRSRFLQRSR